MMTVVVQKAVRRGVEFERLLAAICTGTAGAVLAIEAKLVNARLLLGTKGTFSELRVINVRSWLQLAVQPIQNIQIVFPREVGQRFGCYGGIWLRTDARERDSFGCQQMRVIDTSCRGAISEVRERQLLDDLTKV
jgi:hypothetical protein